MSTNDKTLSTNKNTNEDNFDNTGGKKRKYNLPNDQLKELYKSLPKNSTEKRRVYQTLYQRQRRSSNDSRLVEMIRSLEKQAEKSCSLDNQLSSLDAQYQETKSQLDERNQDLEKILEINNSLKEEINRVKMENKEYSNKAIQMKQSDQRMITVTQLAEKICEKITEMDTLDAERKQIVVEDQQKKIKTLSNQLRKVKLENKNLRKNEYKTGTMFESKVKQLIGDFANLKENCNDTNEKDQLKK